MPDPATVLQASGLFGGVVVLAFFFAKLEIQIEGGSGWATSLPTWRIEKHWLLTLFFGGRALTGYHAWALSFIVLIFHFPCLVGWHCSWLLEARILGSILLFWILEDAFWFLLNPTWGWRRFRKSEVSWHKHWWLGVPADYWIFASLAAGLWAWAFSR